jgi:capsular polysaccharide biosynthesis protein
VPEINLYDLLAHYAKYWLFLAVSIILGLTAGLAYTNYIQVPQYKSNATLILINTDQTSSVKDATTINNYIELVKSRRVLEPVIKDRKLGQSYEQLAESIGTSNDKDTEVVKLSVSTSDPNVSQNVLNDAIASFKKQLKSLYNNDNVQVVDSASLPTEPYNVRSTLQIGLATIASLLLAIIIIFFIYDFNLSRQVAAPIAAVTPAPKKKKRKKVAKTPRKQYKPLTAIKTFFANFRKGTIKNAQSFKQDFKEFFSGSQPPKQETKPKSTPKSTVKKD